MKRLMLATALCCAILSPAVKAADESSVWHWWDVEPAFADYEYYSQSNDYKQWLYWHDKPDAELTPYEHDLKTQYNDWNQSYLYEITKAKYRKEHHITETITIKR